MITDWARRILQHPHKLDDKSTIKVIDESIVGKTFSPDLFKEELKDLGYSFDIFVDKDNKIYRFQRIVPKEDLSEREVW
jgi:hypothetical protein